MARAMILTAFLAGLLVCSVPAGATPALPGAILLDPPAVELVCPDGTCVEPCGDPAQALSEGIREYINRCMP